MRDWLVAADDRTGAFEVAGLLATVVGPVTVTVGVAPAGNGVVDLGSRPLAADEAVALARAVEQQPSAWAAHKIDSTLRGHWADELLARQAVSGRRLVVLPGWPALGRTCVDGLVRVHGEPVARPGDSLPGADLLTSVAALQRWLLGDRLIAVCDVPDSETMHALARVLAGTDVLIAGPGGPLGAAFAAIFHAFSETSLLPAPPSSPPASPFLSQPPSSDSSSSLWGSSSPLPAPPSSRSSPTMSSSQPLPALGGGIAVVCGSANSVSHEQLRRLSRVCPDIAVMAVPVSDGELRPEAAIVLAERAARWIAETQPETIIVIGGDTAAALLGSAPRLVGGFVAPGMPWSRDESGGGPLVVTKAGGFGEPDSLVDLLRSETD